MPEVKVSKLFKQFGDNTVLKENSFTIKDGEFFTLLGPSGCGKSTTLNCIAGLEDPTGGTIEVDGVTFVDKSKKVFLNPEERNLGMVFQSYALWPHMTIEANLAMPLKIRKISKADQATMIHEALQKVGLDHLKNRYPHQLSGGQQQRVALARALVYSPRVQLLDEPLSNLDAKLREQARAWLKRLQADLGITTVYVTHDQDEALALSDRIAVMSGGNMLQIGSPTEIYETPAAAEVAAFVGRCNFLTGEVQHRAGDQILIKLAASGDVVEVASAKPAAVGDQVTVAIRPERLEVLPRGAGAAAAGNVLVTEVMTSAYVGARHEYDLKLGNHAVQALSARGGLNGDVYLTFQPTDALLFTESVVLSEEAEELATVGV
jgi:iron(III) transport system ATP-binding protein